MRHTPFLGRRTTVVTMATAALAVAALAGVALSGPSDPPPAVAATPSASAQADVAAGGDTSPRTTPARVAYLGDSYTVGTGATTAADGWVSLLDDVFGWRGMNLGCGGSGYVSPGGSCGKTYDERIADVVASRPDAVVVSGGLNDARNTDDLNELKLEIDRTFADLRAALPDAEIVAVSPVWGAGRTPPTITIMGAVVETAVAKVDGTFLDIGQPLYARPDLMIDDGIHPNDGGHRAIAQAVAEALVEVAVTRDDTEAEAPAS
jgi:acyl-CoA thioesterase-1